jgi:hypothetical protein
MRLTRTQLFTTLLVTIALSLILVACRGGRESDQSSSARSSTATATATPAATLPGSTPPVVTATEPPTIVTLTGR